jgi:uncharacterized BrkB/YihY/UPF0761 family membrane protein
MAFIQRLVIIVVLVIIGLGVLNSGALDTASGTLTTAATHLTTGLRSLLLALSVPALLLGGVIALSPRHRQLGTEVAVGGVIALVIATAGPVIMSWLGGAMAAYSSSVLGTR